jgi:hypothetical protein
MIDLTNPRDPDIIRSQISATLDILTDIHTMDNNDIQIIEYNQYRYILQQLEKELELSLKGIKK